MISVAKFEELKRAFPKCKIVSDYGTYEPKQVLTAEALCRMHALHGMSVIQMFPATKR